MPRFATLAVALVVALTLAACQPPAAPTLDRQAPPIAHQFFDEVRGGADLSLDPHLAHELKNPTTEEQISQFRGMIPSEPPTAIDLKKWDTKTDGSGDTTQLTELYHYTGQTLMVQTALFKSPGGTEPVIVGFRVSDGGDAQ
jgi:hypothetical protein